MSKGSRRRPETDYEAFCKNWDKIFNAGGGEGDPETVPSLEKGHRPSLHKGHESPETEVEDG